MWLRLNRSGNPPDTTPLLKSITARALAAPDHDADRNLTGCQIHPLVAAAVREQAPPGFQVAAWTELAAFWTTVYYAYTQQEGGEATGVVLLASRSALPYLLRLQDWNTARFMLGQVMGRAVSAAAAAELLPVAQYLVEATVGTDEHLAAQREHARLTGWVDQATGVDASRRVLADALTAGRYDMARATASDAVDACLEIGRYNEALILADAIPSYSARAGYGPWTQIADKRMRLRVLTAQGRHAEVLADIDDLLAHADALPHDPTSTGAVQPWGVRENLLDTARDAAIGSEQWDRALAYSHRHLASQQRRGAPDNDTARTRFATYFPLLRLGRIRDALALLRELRDFYDHRGDLDGLGKTLSALADAEAERGRGPAAIAYERDALRFKYRIGEPEAIAASHHNLGGYLLSHGDHPAQGVIHCLAAAVIGALTGSGYATGQVHDLAVALAAHTTADIPTTPAALATAANQTEGVHLDRMLDTLTPDPEAKQAALDHVLAQARALAADQGFDAPVGEVGGGEP